MEVVLSKRMETVVSMVRMEDAEKGAESFTVADVGCDHAYVSIALIKRKIADRVIAMDVRKGPLEIASKNVGAYGLKSFIDLRLSDGLDKLQEGEADAVVIAGMGGLLIKSILERGIKQECRPVLILQPQSDLYEVRRYLSEIGYVIEKEQMLIEEGKYYTVMRAVPFSVEKSFEKENVDEQLALTYGSFGLIHKDMTLHSFLIKEQEQLSLIKVRLKKTIEDQQKRNESVADKTLNRLASVEKEIQLNQMAKKYFE